MILIRQQVFAIGWVVVDSPPDWGVTHLIYHERTIVMPKICFHGHRFDERSAYDRFFVLSRCEGVDEPSLSITLSLSETPTTARGICMPTALPKARMRQTYDVHPIRHPALSARELKMFSCPYQQIEFAGVVGQGPRSPAIAAAPKQS